MTEQYKEEHFYVYENLFRSTYLLLFLFSFPLTYPSASQVYFYTTSRTFLMA